MAEVTVTIWFPADSLTRAGIYGLNEFEDPLYEAIEEPGIGRVSGSGIGTLGADIMIDFPNASAFEEALSIIRHVLKENGAPPDTVITRHTPEEVVYPLTDSN